LDFTSKYADLVKVETSISAINNAIQLNAAAFVTSKAASNLHLLALQTLKTEVLSQMQKSSDAVLSVAATLRNTWECPSTRDSLRNYHDFKSALCDVGSKSAASVVQISCA
jgi:hypothetical protein